MKCMMLRVESEYCSTYTPNLSRARWAQAFPSGRLKKRRHDLGKIPWYFYWWAVAGGIPSYRTWYCVTSFNCLDSRALRGAVGYIGEEDMSCQPRACSETSYMSKNYKCGTYAPSAGRSLQGIPSNNPRFMGEPSMPAHWYHVR